MSLEALDLFAKEANRNHEANRNFKGEGKYGSSLGKVQGLGARLAATVGMPLEDLKILKNYIITDERMIENPRASYSNLNEASVILDNEINLKEELKEDYGMTR